MLKRGFKAMLAEANAAIETISVQDLPYHLDEADTILIDVRDTLEREQEGMIPGSVHVPRGLLEFQADPESPIYNGVLKPECRVICFCGTGGRSALAAKTLLDMGYQDTASLAGGFAAWKRFRKRALALQEKNRTITLRKEGRGEDPPDFSEKGGALAPLAQFSKEGKLEDHAVPTEDDTPSRGPGAECRRLSRADPSTPCRIVVGRHVPFSKSSVASGNENNCLSPCHCCRGSTLNLD